MAQPAIVLNTNKPIETKEPNNSLLSNDSSLFCHSMNALSQQIFVSNSTSTAGYRVMQVGSTYINNVMAIAANEDYHLSGGTYYPNITGGYTYVYTYGGGTISSSSFLLSACLQPLKVGTVLNSMFISGIKGVIAGSGVNATFEILGGILRADGTFDDFCSSGNIVVSSTGSFTSYACATTTERTSAAGDRVAIKFLLKSMAGTHNTTNYITLQCNGSPANGVSVFNI